ncbi:hypothetical protein ABBQ38_010835 [Trebouxia sp. C0009 RCD-2024]
MRTLRSLRNLPLHRLLPAQRVISAPNGHPSSYTRAYSVAPDNNAPARTLQQSLWQLTLGLGAVAATIVACGVFQSSKCEQQASSGQTKKSEGASRRIFSEDEIAEHATKDNGVWVTYKDGVYDVTNWVDQHPGGGARIMLAAGGAIDPFWAMYAQHQTAEVHKILEAYRIGDLEGGADTSRQVADPYANEPKRHRALIVRNPKPFNAETPKDALGSGPTTPNELFYVRNHLPVPHVEPGAYSLRIEGEGLRHVELSLHDLKTKFKRHSLAAALQCSGNRRHDMIEVKKIQGLDWDIGAIGSAEWSGVKLRDVLRYAGFEEDNSDGVAHVQFEGLDSDTSGTCYGSSIPIDKAMGSHGDVLLAFSMNGRTLSADHGFPLRVVVPGVTGARSVKWLSRIITSKQESQAHWQQHDYKGFSPGVTMESVTEEDWQGAPALQETPVTSAICEPANGAQLEEGTEEVPVRGYAYSGGGRNIIRVDVSADGGQTWHVASIDNPGQLPSRAWDWTRWHLDLPLPTGHSGPLEVCCRAVDSSYNTQPDTVAPIWNMRGIVNNAWHRVKVDVASEA